MKSCFGLLLCFTLLLFSCHNENGEADAPAALSDATSIAGLTGDSVKLVKTGSLNFKVKDIVAGTKAVSGLVQQMGGMVFDQSLTYPEAGRKELKVNTDSLMVVTVSMPQATMTVRVPSEHLEAFLYDVTDLGYFTGSSNIHIEDESLRYLQNALKQKARLEALSGPPSRKNSTLTDLRAVGVKDAMIEQQIANRTIDAAVTYSTVNLTLLQNPLVRKEVIANYDISTCQLPFGQRLGQALGEGWLYFSAFMLVLARLWLFIAAGLTVFLAYRFLQSKGKLSGFSTRLK